MCRLHFSKAHFLHPFLDSWIWCVGHYWHCCDFTLVTPREMVRGCWQWSAIGATEVCRHRVPGCLCVCVCLSMCVYECCVCMCVSVCICECLWLCLCVFLYGFVSLCLSLWVAVYIWVYVYECLYLSVCVCDCVSLCVSMSVWGCVCVFVHVIWALRPRPPISCHTDRPWFCLGHWWVVALTATQSLAFSPYHRAML